ncbi:MAG: hypothetical protein K0R82_356 [Flavipsychrobacter sp.]|jgi:uncharacterized protein (DUF983 family)|nr:hypothetical protein [Flavipsychrobacter sp.]
MQQPDPLILSSILRGKCPECRNGSIYVNKGVFPLKGTLKTVEYCATCKHRINAGSDSAPGINYAISVVVYVLAVIFYAGSWGLTYKDNSYIQAFIFSTVIVLLLQPWLMRLSKTIYIYLFAKFH